MSSRQSYITSVIFLLLGVCCLRATTFSVISQSSIAQKSTSQCIAPRRSLQMAEETKLSELEDFSTGKAVQELDSSDKWNLTPPSARETDKANEGPSDWTVWVIALYPVWVIIDTVFHVTSDKPYSQQLVEGVQNLFQ